MTHTKSMDESEARAYISKHNEQAYTLLDVRQPYEYEQEHIPGAILIPLAQLPEQFGTLQPELPTLVYCSVGNRSRVASQFLIGRGFKEVYSLKGGILAWSGGLATGAIDSGMRYLKGDESTEEIIILAYGMEDGLGSFYAAMAKEHKDEQTRGLLEKLSSAEDNHKQRLFEVYKKLNTSIHDQSDFESKVVSQAMEGGLTSEEFVNQYSYTLGTVRDVLITAMVIETQALDLYLRYAEKLREGEPKNILYNLAEEEKRHLKELGDILDKQR
ncbi:MAG: sulfurtransferase [Candidatus Scalindua sp. SCAELEC01]|nr:sulfurtransferase [Planctomycetota bacterium]RZV75855.1 MAG: sulfurtransferase [Candidatus Scalindua sp. SCAELEC01]